MSFPVYTTNDYILRLTALIASQYPVAPNQTTIRLFKNNVEPDANMTLATFVEADFDGYGAQQLLMAAPSMNDQGIIVTKSGLIGFESAAGVDPQTVYGVFLVLEDEVTVIAAQKFDEPQQMGGVYPQAVAGLWRMSEPLSSYGWLDAEA